MLITEVTNLHRVEIINGKFTRVLILTHAELSSFIDFNIDSFECVTVLFNDNRLYHYHFKNDILLIPSHLEYFLVSATVRFYIPDNKPFPNKP